MGVPEPCTIPLGDPGDAAYVAIFVSIWDVSVTDLSGYTRAHDHYAAFGMPVVWVEVPPLRRTASWWSDESIAAHNDAVAAVLGCTLAPASVRDHGGDPKFSSDGLHYTPEGAELVAARLERLDPASYDCSRPQT